MPVLVRHVDKDSGLIVTSCLRCQMLNSIANVWCVQWSERSVSLGWDNYVTYSSDNTNSQPPSKNTKWARWPKKMFWLWLPLSFSTFMSRKRSQGSVNVENFVIDIDYYFCTSASRKNQLREFMNFNYNEVRKVIYHISTRWLSLGKCLERTLIQWKELFVIIIYV